MRYISKKYLSQLFKTLTSQYPQLITDIGLNNEFRNVKVEQPTFIQQDEEWLTFDIRNTKIFWPSLYDTKGIKGLYKEIYIPYNKNPHAYETEKIHIAEGDWVIDAGACEGFFTLYALERNANVLAIEPVPKLAEALSLTFSKEIKAGRVIVLNTGLGSLNRIAKIAPMNNEVYCSCLSDDEGEEIPIVTLDHILQSNIIPRVDFIKMDIEGDEIEAILGATQTLITKPKLSLAVYHSYLNAKTIKKIIKRNRADYRILFRGVFIRKEFGKPRPYMLYAY